MAQKPEEIQKKALNELGNITSTDELESWRVRYLGRKGELTLILRSLSDLPAEERKVLGAQANRVKTSLENNLKEKEQALRQEQVSARPKEAIDVTLPGRPLPSGRLHPITQTLYETCTIFNAMGFQVVEGPEVEWEYYNFKL